MSLAKVKPEHDEYLHKGKWINQVHMTLSRYRHIWRVYRAAMAWFRTKEQMSPSNYDKSVRDFEEAHGALSAACEAARKAGVK